MKKVLFCLLSLSLFSSISCMNENPLNNLKDSWDYDIDIIELPVERWEEFRALELQAREALAENTALAAQEHEELSAESCQQLLKASLAREGYWTVFAEQHNKLIGMAGAMDAQKQNPALSGVAMILSDYATPRLVSMLGHTDMIETLLEKLQDSGITHAQVQISPDLPHIISFYQKLGFKQLFTIGSSSICMEKRLE